MKNPGLNLPLFVCYQATRGRSLCCLYCACLCTVAWCYEIYDIL